MNSRNTTLDFLRALAIVAVIVCHSAWAFPPDPITPNVLGVGGHGVDLFFVLSGWLLGSQLIAEQHRTGSIDVRRFWLRRWLRTLPAYFAVLFLISAWEVYSKGWGRFEPSYLYFGQTYLTNLPYFGVSWSLCVEEHFYLLVAPLLLLIRWRWGIWVLFVLLLVPSIFRWFGAGEYPVRTHVRYDQCGVGVLLAYICLRAPVAWDRLTRVAAPLALAGTAVVGYAFLARGHSEWGWRDPSPLLWAGVAAAWVLLANSSEFWRNRTGHPVILYLAERSYSLYLIHPEVMALAKRLFGEMSFGAGMLVTWIGSLLAAELIYRFVERPFIRSREWFSWSRRSAEPTPPRLPGAAEGGAMRESHPPEGVRP